LGQVNVFVFKRNDVAGAGDADQDLVILMLDAALRKNVEQLGVQRTPVELKDQVTHHWSNERNSHDPRLCSPLHLPHARMPNPRWRVGLVWLLRAASCLEL